MAVLRPLLAFLALMLGAYGGVVMLVSEACSQNIADSLFAFTLVLPMNLVGMALLGWRPNRIAVLFIGLLPACVAVGYSQVAYLLAIGTPSCTITTGVSAWEPSGEEAFLATGWAVTAAIFWIGLAYALSGGYRPAHDTDH